VTRGCAFWPVQSAIVVSSPLRRSDGDLATATVCTSVAVCFRVASAGRCQFGTIANIERLPCATAFGHEVAGFALGFPSHPDDSQGEPFIP
jgi:hypothetical protein